MATITISGAKLNGTTTYSTLTITATRTNAATITINYTCSTYLSASGYSGAGYEAFSAAIDASGTGVTSKSQGVTLKSQSAGWSAGQYTSSNPSKVSGSFTLTVSSKSALTAAIKYTIKSSVGTSSGNTGSTTLSLPALPSYTVSYNANGGSGAPSSQTKWHGINLTLSSTKPTRTGHTFQGWATSAGGSVAYASGGSYTANAAAALYAVWKADTYTVSYNANGGSGAPSSQTKTYGVDLVLSSTKPTRTNYTFKGWATSAGGSVAYASGGTYTTNAAAALYAVWELAYIKPRIDSLSVARCDSGGAALEDGTCALVSFDWECDKTVSSILIKWITASDDAWSEFPVSASGTSGSVSQIIGDGGISADNTYTVSMLVTDDGGTTERSTTLNSMAYAMDFLKEGKGAAFGKAAELAECLDIGWETIFRKNIWMNKYDDAEKKIYIQNNASREGKTYETDGVRPHRCQIYGGNAASTTAIGLWDIQDAHGIFVYDDVNKIVKIGGSGVGMALQLNGKSLGTGDSGWITAALTSSFTAYGTSQVPKYRKVLNTVEIKGGLKPTAELAAGSTTTIFTLPEGYRPAQAVYVLCQASIKNTWLLTINPGGTVTMSRYGLTEYIAATTGAWLPFHATFFAD